MPYDPQIDIWPYIVQADNGFFLYLANGAIRRLANFEVVYLRDERKVRTIRIEGEAKRPVTASKHVFGLE